MSVTDHVQSLIAKLDKEVSHRFYSAIYPGFEQAALARLP
jgi:hypothetical protein